MLTVTTLFLTAALALPNPNPWQEVRRGEDLRIWARAVPDSSLREVKAEAIIDASLERVWRTLGDLDHYTDFMPYVVEARKVAQNDTEHFEYYRLDPPLVAQRDYTVAVTTVQDNDKGEYVRSWRVANQEGPPPRKDAVRLAFCDGSWTVQRLSPRQSRLSYWLHADPGGAIPNWIANRANNQSLPALFEAVKQRGGDPSWTR